MKSVAVFLRVPSSVAARVAAVILAENKTSGVEPVLLCAGEPSLPQYFARAGEREVERVERLRGHRPNVEEPEAPERAAHEGHVIVPFDISEELATRVRGATKRLNAIRRERGSESICLRAGKPSLPAFFLRAGLLELAPGEVLVKVLRHRVAARNSHRRKSGIPIEAPVVRRTRADDTRSRAARVLALLFKRGPLAAGEIAAKLREEPILVGNTLSSLLRRGRVKRGAMVARVSGSGPAEVSTWELTR